MLSFQNSNPAAAAAKKARKPKIASPCARASRKAASGSKQRARPRRLCVLKPPEDLGLRRVNSRELRGGVLYTDCECNRRNGLQHDCPRERCGDEKCTKEPWPECHLGKYYKKKWACYESLRMKQPKPPVCIPAPYDLMPRYAKE